MVYLTGSERKHSNHLAQSLGIALLAAAIAGCGATPPAYISDQDEMSIYASVLSRARQELAVPDSVPVHPYLTIAADTSGRPNRDLHEFEFEKSAAIQLLQQADNTVIVCAYDPTVAISGIRSGYLGGER